MITVLYKSSCQCQTNTFISMQLQSTSTSDRVPPLPLSPLKSSSDGHIQLQFTTSDSHSESDSDSESGISELESLSSSDGLSSTIQGEERSSHPTSHLPQRSLPLTTPICTEHCNIQKEGMFKGRYELSIMFILLLCIAIHSLMTDVLY